MEQRKGIILAGGRATRLYPLTISISKQILPIYNKPMIYYPLSTLMQIGIREILIISTPEDICDFQRLLKDGSQLGIKIQYKVQKKPNGLAEAFILGEEFIGNSNVAMVLGDNIFYNPNFSEILKRANLRTNEATIFGYEVKDPRAYGVVEFNKLGKVISIEEKPIKPKSKYAVPGLYFYPNDVIKIAKMIKPSQRGELEITSVSETYLESNRLYIEKLGKRTRWFDAGTHNSLLQTSKYVQKLENRRGIYFSYPEEIAYRQKWITVEKLSNLAQQYIKTDYGKHLQEVVINENSNHKHKAIYIIKALKKIKSVQADKI